MALGSIFTSSATGVLEPPGDGHGAAQVDVKLGELLGGQLAGGVDAGPRLADHHVAHLPGGELLEHLGGHELGLPAGGAVADGDVDHPVPPDEGFEGVHGLPLFRSLKVG